MTSFAMFVVVFVTFAVYIDKSDAVCCHAFSWGFCRDCTKGTPYCGYRRCSWIGCNCDGGCRNPPSGKTPVHNIFGGCTFEERGKRSLSDIIQLQKKHEVEASEVFNRYDINKNGEIDPEEFTEALKGMGVTDEAEVSTHWKESDENQDGVITIDELDHDAQQKTS